MDTHQKGRLAQLKVETRAAEKGYVVSVPTLNVRYDLILDDGRKLSRVQVKYGGHATSHASGSVTVDFRRYAGNKQENRHNYLKSEVDAILIYIPAVDVVCWIPSKLFDNKQSLTLRYDKPQQNQHTGVHFVRDLVW